MPWEAGTGRRPVQGEKEDNHFTETSLRGSMDPGTSWSICFLLLEAWVLRTMGQEKTSNLILFFSRAQWGSEDPGRWPQSNLGKEQWVQKILLSPRTSPLLQQVPAVFVSPVCHPLHILGGSQMKFSIFSIFDCLMLSVREFLRELPGVVLKRNYKIPRRCEALTLCTLELLK